MDLKALAGRLSASSRAALEAASGLTLSRTHYDVEVEHWLLKLIEPANGDVARILAHFEVDVGRLAGELEAALDRLRTGNARAPALSPRLVRWMREAWLRASLGEGASEVRPGHLLATLLNDDQLSAAIRESATQLRRINATILSDNYAKIVGDDAASTGRSTVAQPDGAPATPAFTGSGALDKFTIDLTQRARSGGIDPVLGRDNEIRQMIDILTRRRQNNPILTGEAGVGKTAVVEGFALKIAAGEVPDALKGIKLLSLDLGLLQAGAGVKGEFENRLKGVIEEVKTSPTPIVMFIDEAHTLIGAGGAEGQGDAANLLKPALARGEMRTIAATTWAEYKKYFEKDAALTRRFQVVKIEEPSEAAAIEMMRGLVATLEKHHGVRILEEAVEASVRLSHRYIFGRQLPDKAIALLDTACARVGMSQAATPAQLEAAERRLTALEVEAGILERESLAGMDHDDRLAAILAERAKVEGEHAELTAMWERERALVARLAALRRAVEASSSEARVEADSVSANDTTAFGDGRSVEALPLRDTPGGELRAARAELKVAQGERPLVLDVVDRVAVADVVAGWTGIPVGRMMADELQSVRGFETIMGARIRGQAHALEAIGKAMRAHRAGLTDPVKPVGVFLMVGLSGVGKTETAVALADQFYGGAQNMTVINMSEFKEEHKVSMLLGSPPGYVGYGEGGVLTEAVRRRPFGVILLDEMEKAHPGVQDVFYQIFDKGRVKDGQGRDIDFRNTLIIMTSNAGWEAIEALSGDPEIPPTAVSLQQALRPKLLEYFRPAFLGRVTLVPYLPLPSEIMREIIVLALGRIGERLQASHGTRFSWTSGVVDAIAVGATEAQSGARAIDGVLNRSLLPELASIILERLQDETITLDVCCTVDASGKFVYDFDRNIGAESSGTVSFVS